MSTHVHFTHYYYLCNQRKNWVKSIIIMFSISHPHSSLYHSQTEQKHIYTQLSMIVIMFVTFLKLKYLQRDSFNNKMSHPCFDYTYIFIIWCVVCYVPNPTIYEIFNKQNITSYMLKCRNNSEYTHILLNHPRVKNIKLCQMCYGKFYTKRKKKKEFILFE